MDPDFKVGEGEPVKMLKTGEATGWWFAWLLDVTNTRAETCCDDLRRFRLYSSPRILI